MTYYNQTLITGTIRLMGDKWHFIPSNLENPILPIYHHDDKIAEEINSNATGYTEVDALLIDEFSHPELFRDVSWGLGAKCYKLVAK